jgi:hypothetical protein
MKPTFWFVLLAWTGLLIMTFCRTCLADEPGKLSIPPTESNVEASSPGSFDLNIPVNRKEIAWGIGALAAAALGFQVYRVLVVNSSHGEVIGSLAMISGLLVVTNGICCACNWSYMVSNMIVGGFLAMVFGVGIAAQAADTRKQKTKV